MKLPVEADLLLGLAIGRRQDGLVILGRRVRPERRSGRNAGAARGRSVSSSVGSSARRRSARARRRVSDCAAHRKGSSWNAWSPRGLASAASRSGGSGRSRSTAQRPRNRSSLAQSAIRPIRPDPRRVRSGRTGPPAATPKMQPVPLLAHGDQVERERAGDSRPEVPANAHVGLHAARRVLLEAQRMIGPDLDEIVHIGAKGDLTARRPRLPQPSRRRETARPRPRSRPARPA